MTSWWSPCTCLQQSRAQCAVIDMHADKLHGSRRAGASCTRPGANQDLELSMSWWTNWSHSRWKGRHALCCSRPGFALSAWSSGVQPSLQFGIDSTCPSPEHVKLHLSVPSSCVAHVSIVPVWLLAAGLDKTSHAPQGACHQSLFMHQGINNRHHKSLAPQWGLLSDCWLKTRSPCHKERGVQPHLSLSLYQGTENRRRMTVPALSRSARVSNRGATR